MKNKTEKPMRIVIKLLMVVLLFGACNSYKQDHKVINPKKISSKVHVGQGVWMTIPAEYIKAKSYEGYQTGSKYSSISVKTINSSIETVKKKFDLQYLKKRNTELLELSTVEYGENKDAFFSVVHDKRKKTIRYLLAINDGTKTYNIKAFCFHKVMKSFDKKIRKALFSAYIGERIEKEELFKLVKIGLEGAMIYTKDGVLPTTSEDSSVIKVIFGESFNEVLKTRLVEEELQKITKKKSNSVTVESLESGKHV